MADQYDADKRTVGELLSMTSPAIEVPEWQRSYSWDTAQVDTFWQDLIFFSNRYPEGNVEDQEYFLGSIVLVVGGPSQLLLDGQQRLGTATILLSVIRDYLSKYKKDAATRTSQKYITDFDDESGMHSFKLTLNHYDRDFFRSEVQEQPPSPDERDFSSKPSFQLASHDLIWKARKFFWDKFEEKYRNLGGGEEAFKWSLRIRKVLTDHISVVVVKSEDEDNAANVFETLNDRGIGLSTPDLLRNLLLRRANDSDREEIIDCWRRILEIEEEARVEDFIRHYWLSYRGDVKTRALYREIKQAVQAENRDSLEFSRDLRDAAVVYRELVAARDDDAELRRLLQGVDALGAKALLPAVLSAYDVGDLEQKRTLLHALISHFVRHNVIGNLENSRLETVVFNVAKELRENSDFNAALQQIVESSTQDEQFAEQFKTAQVSRQKSARYILRELEHAKRRTQELEVSSPNRVHVEHIYPQEPKPDQRWPNHPSIINRLGNLTLLASRLNTAIKNSDFATKKAYYERSELVLTKELLEYDSWNTDTIARRQGEMSELASQTWRFPEQSR